MIEASRRSRSDSLLTLGTTQACLFRDEFSPLTATGYSIFGLSSDSPKSNTTFKTKQRLPFTLLCDSNATLIAAIGMRKSPKGIVRGVFVVSKASKIEAVEPGVRIDRSLLSAMLTYAT